MNVEPWISTLFYTAQETNEKLIKLICIFFKQLMSKLFGNNDFGIGSKLFGKFTTTPLPYLMKYIHISLINNISFSTSHFSNKVITYLIKYTKYNFLYTFSLYEIFAIFYYVIFLMHTSRNSLKLIVHVAPVELLAKR